eukprot:619385-Karenia_brevis.AAC.1
MKEPVKADLPATVLVAHTLAHVNECLRQQISEIKDEESKNKYSLAYEAEINPLRIYVESMNNIAVAIKKAKT